MGVARRRWAMNASGRKGRGPGIEIVRVRLAGEEYAVVRLSSLADVLPEGLTEAERDIVGRVLEGRSNAAIARARGTSARTVANQLAGVFRKLGVQSRSELARLCARLRAGGGQRPDFP
jgi:DNA-binding CsgD family transcriptional regulator